jgi:hypothetical protein
VSSAFPDGAPLNPSQPASPPERAPLLGLFSGKPISLSPLPPQVFGLPDDSKASGNGDWFDFLAGIASQNSTQPALQAAGGKPERYLGRRVVGRSQASAFDTGAPALPFARSNVLLAPDRQDSFDGTAASSPSVGYGAMPSPPMIPPQQSRGSVASTLMDYVRYLNELDGKNSQASVFGTSAPPVPLAPSDAQNVSGGVLGRVAALAGIDPQNPAQLAPPPLDDQPRGYYRDDPVQPWFVQRQR